MNIAESKVIENYSSLAFANLHEFDIAKKLMQGKEEDITNLGEIIKKHDMGKIVGVSLLHKHFNLFEDEKLVRKYQSKKFKIAPEFGNEKITPYAFAFAKTKKDQQVTLYPVEFIELMESTEVYKENLNKLNEKHDFSREFKNYLLERNIQEIFGISFLPYHLIKLNNDEMLLETHDDASTDERALKIEPVQSSSGNVGVTTKTLWDLESGQGNMNCKHHCDH